MAQIDWNKLFDEAANGLDGTFLGTVEITMAEELAFGFYPMELVAIKDTEGRTWILYETTGDDEDARGLVSRYNVRPGMKFRLKVTKRDTQVFCVTPEFEGRPEADPRRVRGQSANI
jgi:hypothetical protein